MSKGTLPTLLIVAIGLTGCNIGGVSSNADVSTVEIVRSDDNVTAQFDSLFQYKNHIILETTEESLLGPINKVVFDKDTIFILNGNSKISVFDKTGKYVRTLSKIGHGPGEYLRLYDFDVFENIVYCLDGPNIHKYDTSGNYIETNKLENSSEGICLLKSGIALNNAFGSANDNTKENYSYTFIHRNGEVHNALRYNPALTGRSFTISNQVGKFSKYNEDVLVYFPFNDTVFKVDSVSGDIKPFMNVKIGDRNIDESTSAEDVDRLLKSDVPRNISSLYKIDNKVLFRYLDDYPKTVLIETGEKDMVLMNGILTIDKNGLLVTISELSSSGPCDEILSIVPPSFIHKRAAKVNLNDFPIFEDILKRTDEESNPILVFYKPYWCQ